MLGRLAWLAPLVALVLVNARTRADILAVEYGIPDSISGTTYVVPPDVLRFATPGGTRSTFATANLGGPIGISLDSNNNVYVVNQGLTATSTAHDSVSKYSSTGTPLGFYVSPATPPGNTLNAPVDIAFAKNGNAHVTSGTTPNPPYGYVAIYNSAGAFQLAFGLANTNLPSGIVFNPVNNLLYLVNSASSGPGPNPNSILIYNPFNIAASPTIITPTGAGALDGPQQIAVDPVGDIYVASFGALGGVAKIQEYTSAGSYIRTVATVAAGGAEGVVYDPTTNILYASYLNGGGSTGFIEKYQIGNSVSDLGTLATGLNKVAYLAYTPGVTPPPTPAPVSTPEPSSLALLALGGVALAGWLRWKKRRVAG